MKYIILILIAMTAFPAFSQKNYESVWKKVDSLSNLGQARSALEIADQIFNETRAENNAPQFLKAVLYRMALKSGFEEEFLENAISSTEGDIAEARPPVKNILHSVLAGLYWRYYQDNRYKFLSRTETTGFPETDIRSWDLRKIVQECVRNYSLSLENPGLLKQIKPGEYDAILLQHPETRRFRPTLFDFLAHQAIDFYSNSEAGLTQPAARFLVEKSEYFGSSEIFSSLRIETPDTLSFEYNAMRLLQQLVAFHAPDQDPAALADAEIRRLKFVHEHCVLPEKDSLFLSALQNLEKRFAGQPCSADVVYETALQLVSGAESYHPLESPDHKWDLKKAYSLAGEAVRQFPGTEGANNCRTLLEQISGLALDISTDYASVPGKPFLALVNYKNIPGVQLRLVRIDPMEDRNLNEAGTNKALHEYLGSKAEKSWWQALPDDGDHQSHKAEIKLPALDPGFYALLASPDQNFSPDTLISLNRFWSTRISYINRRNDDGSNEVFVLDRQEGQPLEKVRVQSFSRNYDYNSRKYLDVPGQTLITGKNGYVSIPAEKKDRNNQFYLVFGTDKNQFITESYFFGFNYGSPEVRTYVSTHFFTDRAIYRPGQTIYFKGIVVEHKGDEVKIKAGTKSLVTFFDVNGQKVSSLNLITNEFGSFAGSFTAPQGVLTGQMSIQCETGDISIQVEEYKRPKFEVTFKPLEGSYKLGETVTVTGKAMAFSGNPAADASVKYRVMRRARFPYMWWGWQNRMPESPAMEITNGLATTNEQGEFTIPFRAIADPTVDRKFDPVFNYTVFATVTDLNGETHDGETSVEAGYKALIIKTDLAKEINLDSLFEFPLSATNLSGQKQNVQGQLIIWKLNEPGRLLRKRNWNRPDCFTMSRQEFEKDFPFDIYDNEGDITAWEKQKQVFAYDFDTRTDSVIRPGIRKQAGSCVRPSKTSLNRKAHKLVQKIS